MVDGLGAVWAVLAAWLAPGAALAAWLGLGRDGLERLVVSFAIGRLLLAAVSLAAVSSVGPAALHVWAGLGVVAWLVARRTRRAAPPSGTLLPVAVVVLAACALVACVVGQGGLVAADGDLVFRGRDTTNDPLVYSALALQLHETGLPLTYPFAAGVATTSSYAPYGVMVALHTFGVPMLDVTFRVLPWVDAFALGLAAVALVRAVGGGRLAAALGGALVLLGGDPSFWLRPLGVLLGRSVQALDTWAYFGPYLFAFNPGTAALQLAFAAFLVLLALRPDGRVQAIVAGLLVAGLFETKVFVWAPVFAALCAVAWLWPPAPLKRPLRLASTVSALAVLPFVAEKVAWAVRLRGLEVTQIQLCPGCLPRYLVDAALGSHELSFRAFEQFELAQLAAPRALGFTALAALLTGAVALGARAVALPGLWRAARAADPAQAALHRWVIMAAGFGLAAALLFTTAPHYLNGAQFAWIATVGLWPFAALVLAGWWRERRLIALVVAAALVAPGSWHALVDLGVRAPQAARVSANELALVERLRAQSSPRDVVLEPSLLANTDFPSSVAWFGGRSVYLSLLSAAKILPEAEIYARYDRLVEVFAGRDRTAALRAIRASGATWVLAPAAWPLGFESGVELEVVERGAGGTLYRVRWTDRAARARGRPAWWYRGARAAVPSRAGGSSAP